jgi:multicomponent Na+:H+ antiporter subunit G
MRYVIDALIVISLFFALAGVVGMLRMPDTFCRMQSATNIATMGVLGVVIGGILYAAIYLGNAEMAIKLAVIGVFYIITNPISGHALAKGAYKHGVRPEKKMVVDRYEEDFEQ